MALKDIQSLRELAEMSIKVGSRVDYTQGGGGNTSVKLDNGYMAIKASGTRLSQMTENKGFAVVQVSDLKDVTADFGYDPLRPSVEASFHVLLKKFVCHTHPVYANIPLCSIEGTARIIKIMKEIDASYLILPYINPGKELADYMKKGLTEAIPQAVIPDHEEEFDYTDEDSNRRPIAVFMQNHGLVVSADTAEKCLEIHEKINELIAMEYGIKEGDFDAFAKDAAKTLYPDQQVYMSLGDVQQEIFAAVSFIHHVIINNNETIRGMDDSAMDFIGNWESEAYRKTVLS